MKGDHEKMMKTRGMTQARKKLKEKEKIKTDGQK